MDGTRRFRCRNRPRSSLLHTLDQISFDVPRIAQSCSCSVLQRRQRRFRYAIIAPEIQNHPVHLCRLYPSIHISVLKRSPMSIPKLGGTPTMPRVKAAVDQEAASPPDLPSGLVLALRKTVLRVLPNTPQDRHAFHGRPSRFLDGHPSGAAPSLWG